MTDVFGNIEKLERDHWEAADNLRANSKLTSSVQSSKEAVDLAGSGRSHTTFTAQSVRFSSSTKIIGP